VTALKLVVKPIEADFSFRNQVYHALKQAITSMNIYDSCDSTSAGCRRISASAARRSARR
jgi:hypothetical protein